jgi:hypothetical protein
MPLIEILSCSQITPLIVLPITFQIIHITFTILKYSRTNYQYGKVVKASPPIPHCIIYVSSIQHLQDCCKFWEVLIIIACNLVITESIMNLEAPC